MLLPSKEHEQKKQLESLDEQDIKESLERLLRFDSSSVDTPKIDTYKDEIDALIWIVINNRLFEDSLQCQRMRELLLVLLEHQKREPRSVKSLLGFKKDGKPKTYSNVLILIEHTANRYLGEMGITESQKKIASNRNRSVDAIHKAIKRAREKELERAMDILRSIFFASEDSDVINCCKWTNQQESVYAKKLIERILSECDMTRKNYVDLVVLLSN